MNNNLYIAYASGLGIIIICDRICEKDHFQVLSYWYQVNACNLKFRVELEAFPVPKLVL